MAQAGQHKCLNCDVYFTPDGRVGERQRYCSVSACQRASKVQSQRRWRSLPQNRDYFCGPVHLARVRAWREAHPGYSRQRPPRPPLQDQCPPQPADSTKESVDRTWPPPLPLQDLISGSSPILVGLIAHLFQVTLQDEMATTARRLVKLGTDVLEGINHG